MTVQYFLNMEIERYTLVALIAAVLLFGLPVKIRDGEFTLTWADAVTIDWGTILLFGGGLSLGT